MGAFLVAFAIAMVTAFPPRARHPRAAGAAPTPSQAFGIHFTFMVCFTVMLGITSARFAREREQDAQTSSATWASGGLVSWCRRERQG